MKTRTAVLVLLGVMIAGATGRAQDNRPKKVDIVSVTGCLREQGANNWMAVAATDPVASNANAPVKSEIPTTAVTGKNQFKLIGVGEFNLPNYRNQTVVVKGLYIKAAPVDRLNITSITTAVTFCAESAPK
jgi:hypothetical protein